MKGLKFSNLALISLWTGWDRYLNYFEQWYWSALNQTFHIANIDPGVAGLDDFVCTSSLARKIPVKC